MLAFFTHQTDFTKMPISIAKYFFLFFFSSVTSLTEAVPTYSSHYCTDSMTYEPNSTFQTNLNLIFSSLSSNAGDGSHFYRTRIGDGTPNVVNGLFLCRADTLAAACHECVSIAAGEIKRRCPVQKEAIIWYDVCTLQYANQSFNNIVPGTDMSNTKNIAAKFHAPGSHKQAFGQFKTTFDI